MQPTWDKSLRQLYESYVTNTFVLHGNTSDKFIITEKDEKCRLGNIEDAIRTKLLANSEIIFNYDISTGLSITRGQSAWTKLTGHPYQTPNTQKPNECLHSLTWALDTISQQRTVQVSCIIRDLSLIAPTDSHDLNTLATIRDWSRNERLTNSHTAIFLVCDDINNVHKLLAENPRSTPIAIPLPTQDDFRKLIELLKETAPNALAQSEHLPVQLLGLSLNTAEGLIKQAEHNKTTLTTTEVSKAKKELVEREANGLIEFIPPGRKLDDLFCSEATKKMLRTQVNLLKSGQTDLCAMGILLPGPVGAGKTETVLCLAGEADIPTVLIKASFRDKWVGGSEANLEKIFRLIRALKQCCVFIDEADTTLGRRNNNDSNPTESRIYSEFAKMTGDTANRGHILWLYATSHPELLEVDLKRPGRVDIRIPIFPSDSPETGYELLRHIATRQGVELPAKLANHIEKLDLLTASAANSLLLELRTEKLLNPEKTYENLLLDRLASYNPPVSLLTIIEQVRAAVAETSDERLIPIRFKDLAQ